MIPGTLIPAWICVPIATLMMVVLLLHTRATARSSHPASRKRLRIANGIVMFINMPLLATGFSVIDAGHSPRAWLLIWIAAMALLAFSVLLAIMDMLNTVRLARRAAREMTQSLLGLPTPPGAGASDSTL